MSVEQDLAKNHFFTPEQFAHEQSERMVSQRGKLLIASCRSGTPLSLEVTSCYERLLKENASRDGVLHLEDIDWQFSDSETCARLKTHVSGYDAFIIQSIIDPINRRSVDENYIALLAAVRVFRESGASHVTVLKPSLAYGRQDKPTKFMREPEMAKLWADFTVKAGADRVITWHPHSDSIRGFYSDICTNFIEPVTLVVEEYKRFIGRDDVIVVAPDAGAYKDVATIGRLMKLSCAVGSKERPEPEVAKIVEIIGDFRGKKTALVIDDIISTAGTLYDLIVKLVTEKGIKEIHIFASHNLCKPKAKERLLELASQYCLKELVVTNSVPQTEDFLALPFIKVRDLAETFARVINRIHYNHSVSEIFIQPY